MNLLSGIATLVAWEWPALGIKGESSAAHSRSLRRLGRAATKVLPASALFRQPCARGAVATWNCQLGLAGRGGRVWAAASAAWHAQRVWRLADASGAAGLHGAAAMVERHSRTLEPVDAAAYDALLRFAFVSLA